MQKRWDTILDPQGRPIAGATVLVRTYPGAADATIYSDDGVTQKANPMVTDEDGYFEYYAANGHYTWVVTTNVETKTYADILHDDSLTTNQQFAAATGTGDAMVVAAFATGYTLADGDEIRVRAPGANTVTNPTIQFPGVGVLTIYRAGGRPLFVYDIKGAGHELHLRYRVTPSRAELVNAGDHDIVNPKTDFGAVGDGVADDTAALQNAINTGKTVRGTTGDTYLVDGGITNATVGQEINLTGCSVKLKNSASSKTILRLNGARSQCIGGTWDLNKTNNATGDQYTHQAVMLAADGCKALGMYVKDSHGLGIKGGAGISNSVISENRIEGCKLHGIYVETLTADAVNNRISDNYVDGASMEAGAVGIYLTCDFGAGFYQRRWNISRNVVKGHQNGAITTVGITARGVEGVYQGNQVTGCLLQHSLDITDRSTISGNRGTDAATTGTTYGLEVNGGHNAISGNYMKGQSYGIVGTSTSRDLQRNAICGNVIEDPKVYGLYLNVSGTATAKYTQISGNTIKAPAGVGLNGAIRLAGTACQDASIVGNLLVGPGSGVASGRGIFLDTVNGHVHIVGNRFVGWERPVALYNAGAVAQDEVQFLGNDLTDDIVTGDANWLAVEGLATLGTRVTQLWNSKNGDNTVQYMDRAANQYMQWSNSFNSPEGNATAGFGSIYAVNIGGRSPMFWLKENGTGNTGWRGLVTNSLSADKGDAIATLTPGTSEHTSFWNTPLTANRAVTLATAAVQNGARFRVVRTAASTGASTLDIAHLAGTKSLATGQWADFEFDGTNWRLTAAGAL